MINMDEYLGPTGGWIPESDPLSFRAHMDRALWSRLDPALASRGNLDRIPRTAVTVGMKEILEARKIRLYRNRPWQCAIVRKLLHGPVTAAVPASPRRSS